jgi:GH15 family glucan-1,4-alpha-glucosidase
VARDVADFALLSDSKTAALVTRDGVVEWWPGGRFDGPSAFNAMLDPDGGHFTLRPANGATRTTRRYEDGTLVLRTEHEVEGGARLVVHDALALEAGAVGHEIGHHSPDALVRVAQATGGDVEVEVELVPRLEYGLAVPRVVRERGQVVTIGGPERLFCSDGGVLEPEGGHAAARFTLRDGERCGFAIRRGPGVEAGAPEPLDPYATVDATIEAWRSWSDMHGAYEGPYRDEVLQAARIVQGLTYQPTGAIVAAASTSLPEVPGDSANWDYRYAWLRDASIIARALLDATCSDEAIRYFRWMSRAAVSCRYSSHVQIVFGVAGERQLDERALDHLRGFADSRPVRIGNAAWRQRQLDVLGEVLDVAYQLGDELEDELDEFTAGFLCQLVDRAAEDWREPDRGMWEVRDADHRHTMSAAMCWVALDRGVRLADKLGEHATPDEWAAARDEVHEAVLREGWNAERGAFTGRLNDDVLDASVLLLPLVGFIDARDERMTSTCDALQRELGPDGLLRRTEERPHEAAFLPTAFWLAACRAQAGDPQSAREVFERAASFANDVGLFPEMADGTTDTGLGNVPQALTHVAMVTAARYIGEAEKEER